MLPRELQRGVGWRIACDPSDRPFTQGPLNGGGGFKQGGVSRSGLVLPFLSFFVFFVLFGTFPIFLGFPRFAWGWIGDFPDLSFSSFSAYSYKSTYEEQSRKGPRHNLDLSQKSGKRPGLETPRFSFSQFTGVSGPFGLEFLKKNMKKRVFLGVCKKVPENTRKRNKKNIPYSLRIISGYF